LIRSFSKRRDSIGPHPIKTSRTSSPRCCQGSEAFATGGIRSPAPCTGCPNPQGPGWSLPLLAVALEQQSDERRQPIRFRKNGGLTMGGFGSGRPAFSATCEDCRNIDLAWLRQRGMLQLGRYCSLIWSRGGEQAGSIALTTQRDGVRLLYQT